MNGYYQILFLLLFYIPFILFVLTLQKTLRIISPENRKMQPSDVSLIIIPVFGIIWQFKVVTKIAESIKSECVKLNIHVKEKRPTYAAGLIYCISYLFFLVPALKSVVAVLVIITWIVYWIKVSQFKKLLATNKHNYIHDA